MAHIRLEDIHKTYPNGHQAVKAIALEIADGELMVLVGPSGCGKSTVLRMVAGLEMPTRGRIWIGDRDVTTLRPQERDVAMVFQNYALYPHKTVRKNLAFALELRKTPRPEIDRRIADVSRALGLDALLDDKPAQLSGGQRQRVALGRAIVREPRAFLFDEPLSNLDAKLRVHTRAELTRIHRRLGATMIYVTHDQEEAMTLGDRIAVLRDGRLQQCAPPLDVYRTPVNAFVAGFVGSPSMNFMTCSLTREGDTFRLENAACSLAIPLSRAPNGTSHQSILMGIRPEDVEIAGSGDADIVARVDIIERLGAEVLVHVDVEGAALAPIGSSRADEEDVARDFRVVVDAETPIREDDSIGLRFRRDRLHLFDPATGVRLQAH
jgi:multiple sugar transport system ATP-binding protein